MKHFLLLLSLFSATLSFGETVYRQNNESTQNFVRRIARTNNFSHAFVESNTWDSTYWAIFYFVPATSKKESDIVGYLLLPENYKTYKRILIDTFNNNGGIPQVDSVFFANADKDKDYELVIMTSSVLDHPGLVGTIYDTYVYDNPDPNVPTYRLKYFKELSDKLDGGLEGKRYNQKVKAGNKDVADVKAALRRMGY